MRGGRRSALRVGRISGWLCRSGVVAATARSRSIAPDLPTAPATAAATTTAPAVAGRALVGFVHLKRTALQLAAVQLGNGLLGLARRAHLDERESTRASRVAIHDDRGGFAGSDGRE